MAYSANRGRDNEFQAGLSNPSAVQDYRDRGDVEARSVPVSVVGEDFDGNRDRNPGTRDRNPGTRDRNLGNRDRNPGTRDRSSGTRVRNLGNRDRSSGTRGRSGADKPSLWQTIKGLFALSDSNGDGKVDLRDVLPGLIDKIALVFHPNVVSLFGWTLFGLAILFGVASWGAVCANTGYPLVLGWVIPIVLIYLQSKAQFESLTNAGMITSIVKAGQSVDALPTKIKDALGTPNSKEGKIARRFANNLNPNPPGIMQNLSTLALFVFEMVVTAGFGGFVLISGGQFNLLGIGIGLFTVTLNWIGLQFVIHANARRVTPQQRQAVDRILSSLGTKISGF